MAGIATLDIETVEADFPISPSAVPPPPVDDVGRDAGPGDLHVLTQLH